MTVTTQPKSYVRTGADGAMRIGESDVPIESVLVAFHGGIRLKRSAGGCCSLHTRRGVRRDHLLPRKSPRSGRIPEPSRKNALWADWRAKAKQGEATVIQRLRAMRNAAPEPTADGEREQP